MNKDDIYTISELIRIYVILKDKSNANMLCNKAEDIIKKNPFSKYIDKFKSLNLSFDEEIKLLDFSKTGYFIREGEKIHVGLPDEEFVVKDMSIINNQVKHMDKVYFGVYSINDNLYADFIEPYFSSIENLWELK